MQINNVDFIVKAASICVLTITANIQKYLWMLFFCNE